MTWFFFKALSERSLTFAFNLIFMIHHLKRATRHLIFWSLIASAISLTGVRLLLLGIDNYKADLSARVSELVGAPVRIGHLRANMRGYKPELILKDIEILPAVPTRPARERKPRDST